MHTAAKRLLPIAALLFAGFAANASAQQPGTFGLGSSWPNTPDVSLSPNYHVYRFIKDGVTYIQVNDLQGNPRVALAVSRGIALRLPVGSDNSELETAGTSSTADASSSSQTEETVYRDTNITLMSAVSSSGDNDWKSRVN